MATKYPLIIAGVCLPDSTTYWSDDGTTGGAVPPTSSDDVIFNDTGGWASGGTVGDGTARAFSCRSLTFAQSGNITITPTTTVNTNGPAVTLNKIVYSGAIPSTQYTLNILGSGTVNVTNNGAWGGNMVVNGPDVVMQDAPYCYTFRCYSNTDFNGHGCTALNNFYPSVGVGKTLYLRGGEFILGAFSGSALTVAGTIDFGTAMLAMVKAWSNPTLELKAGMVPYAVRNAGSSYMNFTVSGGTAASITTLSLASGTEHRFANGCTWTVGSVVQTGTPSNTTTLRGTSTTGTWGLVCATNVSLTKASIQYGAASGAGQFVVDRASSTIDANSSGWLYDDQAVSSKPANGILAMLF